jgi:hypothetical protein
MVNVHQVVRDLNGGVIADQHVQHVYTISEYRCWARAAGLPSGIRGAVRLFLRRSSRR